MMQATESRNFITCLIWKQPRKKISSTHLWFPHLAGIELVSQRQLPQPYSVDQIPVNVSGMCTLSLIHSTDVLVQAPRRDYALPLSGIAM